MFLHIFINKFKIILKNKSMIFWTFLFPIALATFFNLAFSNLTKQEKFSVIDIAVVDIVEVSNNEFKSVLENLSKQDENRLFNIVYVPLEKAQELLDNNNISGYILLDKDINVVVKRNGLDQTVLKSVVDSYYQMSSVVENIYINKPEAIKNGIMSQLNKNDNYFKDISNEKVNFTVIYFYTLIGMVALYGGFFGINAVNEIEANLSVRAARTNVAPTHKLKVLLISLLVAIIIQYTEMLLLLAYLVFILGVNFGPQIGYILFLALIGTISGISMGTLIGVSNKKTEDSKVGILFSITMLFSFLAGMMVIDIRYLIADKVPLLNIINPVNMITDALYSLYYYNTLDKYFYNIINLCIFILIMITFSYIILRRKKYDSI